jgi:hypothetical protein
MQRQEPAIAAALLLHALTMVGLIRHPRGHACQPMFSGHTHRPIFQSSDHEPPEIDFNSSHQRRFRNGATLILQPNATDERFRQKCSQDWPNPRKSSVRSAIQFFPLLQDQTCLPCLDTHENRLEHLHSIALCILCISTTASICRPFFLHPPAVLLSILQSGNGRIPPRCQQRGPIGHQEH